MAGFFGLLGPIQCPEPLGHREMEDPHSSWQRVSSGKAQCDSVLGADLCLTGRLRFVPVTPRNTWHKGAENQVRG